MSDYLFYPKLPKYQYLYSKENYIKLSEIDKYDELRIPLVIDTEFQQKEASRLGVTIQIKGIFNTPKIFSHIDLKNYCDENDLTVRHTVSSSQFCVIDYLKSLGINANFKVRENKKISPFKKYKNQKIPVIQFDIYAHFALAELLMIFNGDARKDIIDIIAGKINKNTKIELKRRLRTYTIGEKNIEICDSVELPFFTIINDKKYRTKLRIIDSFALHGIASYKDLALNTGIELKYKDSLSQSEKENMIETYFNNPEKFDDYALGDLEVYNFLESNSKLFEKIYQSLNISEFFTTPKLTIGSTTNKLFQSVLFKYFGLFEKEKQDIFLTLCSHASSNKLKHNTKDTSCLLAKVFGGRCRNNRPLSIAEKEKTLIDIDIKSAYGTTLFNQVYPIGKPIIESFDNIENKDNNCYLSLREWLKKRKYGTDKSELVDGLWICFVSVKESKNEYSTLINSQDFLISWFDFKYEEIESMLTDSEQIDIELNPKTGKVKILNNQIVNAVINSDFIEWLEKVCNPKQKKELLDNLYVLTSCYYPSYSQVNTLDELLEKSTQWQENSNNKNTTNSEKTKDNTCKITKINHIDSYWLGVNLGELLIKDLLSYREFYKARDGKKSSLQTLFKLLNNTLYGVFCSPYFDISNTVVGNNITSKVRAMSWYMEKGFYGYETITDGTQFDINKVVFPLDNRSVTATSVCNLYQEKDVSKKNLRLKPLSNYQKIEHFWDGSNYKLKLFHDESNYTIIDNYPDWINTNSLNHLKSTFPNVSLFNKSYQAIKLNTEKSLEQNKPIVEYLDRIGLFELETKDVYDCGVFHGTSNYLLSNKNDTVIKMRSYESKKNHYTFDENLIETYFYKDIVPSEFFLKELMVNSEKVNRSKSFKKQGILKTNEFKNNADKWLEYGLVCGDSIEKSGLLRELSLSQFTFKSINQLLAIEKEFQRNKRRFEQSFEGYFINEDGTLNYELMIKTIDLMIQKDLISFNQYLDKSRHRHRLETMNHPDKIVYQKLKETIIAIKKNNHIQDEIFDYEIYLENQENDLENIDLDF